MIVVVTSRIELTDRTEADALAATLRQAMVDAGQTGEVSVQEHVPYTPEPLEE